MKIFGGMKRLAYKHKIISLIIILCLLGGGYWWYASSTSTTGVAHYVLAAVSRGTIISSVSGTGQVSPSDQMDIKPEISGKLIYLNIQKDKEVSAGTLLAELDASDAQKTLQSAENDLSSAQLSSQDINGTAKDALNLAYSNGLDALTTTFADLTSMRANLDSMFLNSSYRGNDGDINYYLNFVRFYDNSSSSDLNFWTTDSKQKYTDIQNKLDTLGQVAWTLNINSQPSQIEDAVNQNYNAVETFLDLIRQTSNLVQNYQKILNSKSLSTPIILTTTATQANQLSADLSLIAKDATALSTSKTDITNAKQSFSKINVNTQSQNLSIQQYKNAVTDAKDALSKYYIYAPLGGIISAADKTIKNGDTISAGTVLGSIVTKQEIIETSFNEIDIVKIELGQKATITFDALPNKTATGIVTDIDTVGTVSQGVVSYGVKIALDIIDSQVKPGMSASVNVIVDTKQNVLTAPNSAVKTKNGNYYVLVLSQKQDLTSSAASQGFISAIVPSQKPIEVGIADNTNTEITSGLLEGDQVVVRIISSTKTSTAVTSTTSRTTRQATQSLTGGGPPGGF